ncbi:MAG: EAL domain-containing protein [Pseudomonadota bacterium]|nr:EAL domain-containing protein [Pseudomonadota bacterium]
MSKATAIHILLVEDDASDAFLLNNGLSTTCPDEFSIAHAHSLEEALPALAMQMPDIALLDLSLPGSSGLEALKILHGAAPLLPIVILTGHADEALALTSLKHGAQDYLIKEEVDGHHIRRAARYAIERKRFEGELAHLANHDALTRLANRSLFEKRLHLALARAKRSGKKLAVFFLDLNKFKEVNDRLGHEAGDALLREVAARLSESLRECDVIARLGGDEFAVLAEETGDARNCAAIAEKIIRALRTPISLPEGEAAIGISIGIALGGAGLPAEALMRHADAAMYRAKTFSESSYQIYTEHLHQEAAERLQLEQELVAAIAAEAELCLYYQPKLHLHSGRLAGAEALMRWNHPSRGLLLPREFLSVATPPMASSLDRWVLETVCRDIQCWQAAGLKPLQVSIHLSNRQWEDAGLVGMLQSVLKNASLEARALAVEVEETAILHSTSSIDTLARVRDMGVEVHLDNFGSDVSSLKLLTRYPLDAIKIDRRLTRSAGTQEPSALLTRTLIDLGHRLGMTVVAEGVETLEQRDRLSALQCDEAQGTIIASPLPAADFFQWVGQHQDL